MAKEKENLNLSVSRVDCFKQCQRKYYYRYIEKQPSEEKDYLQLGTFAHGVLEKFHEKFTKEGAVEDVNGLMKKSFDEQKKEKELDVEIIKQAFPLIKEYLKKIKKGFDAEVLSVEKKFSIKLNDNYNFIGFIDRVDMDKDGIFHVIDYKTSKTDKYMKSFQLCAYGIPLLKHYSDVEKFRGSYIMLKLSGRKVSYEFNKEDVEKITKDLIEMGDRIVAERKWTPNISGLCNHCDYKKICLSGWE